MVWGRLLGLIAVILAIAVALVPISDQSGGTHFNCGAPMRAFAQGRAEITSVDDRGTILDVSSALLPLYDDQCHQDGRTRLVRAVLIAVGGIVAGSLINTARRRRQPAPRAG